MSNPTLDQLAEQAATWADLHNVSCEGPRLASCFESNLPLDEWCVWCVIHQLPAATQAQREQLEQARQNAETWAKAHEQRIGDILAQREELERLRQERDEAVASGYAWAGRAETAEAQLTAQREQLNAERLEVVSAIARKEKAERDSARLREQLEQALVMNKAHEQSIRNLKTQLQDKDEQLAQVTRERNNANHNAGEMAKLSDAAEAQLTVLKDFVQELADEPCAYDDNCPMFGTRHGTCLNCKARAALAQGEPSSVLALTRNEWRAMWRDVKIIKGQVKLISLRPDVRDRIFASLKRMRKRVESVIGQME